MEINEFLPVREERNNLTPFLSKQYEANSRRAKNMSASMRSITKARREEPSANPIIAVQKRFMEQRQKEDKELRAEAAREYFNEQQSALNASVSDQPPQTQEDVEVVADLTQENYLESLDLSRLEKDYLENLGPEAAEQYITTEANSLLLKNEMANLWEQTGAGDLAWDIGDIFLLNDQSFTSSEIAEGNYFTSAGDVEKRVEAIRQIPDPTERRQAFKDYIETVKRTTGNSLDRLDYLAHLDEPRDRTFEEGLDKAALAFDAITVAGAASTLAPAAIFGLAGAAVTTGVRTKLRIKNAFDSIRDVNAIKSAKNVGAKEEAATMSNAAAKDREAADALGVSQDAAAANHLPYAFEGLIPGAADGLSDTLSEYSIQSQKLKEFIDQDLLKEGLKLDADEAEAFRIESQKDLESADDVVNVRPLETTPTGIKFEVEYTKKPNPNDTNPPRFDRVMGNEFKLEDLSLVKTGQGWKLYQGAWNNPNRTHMKTFNTKKDAEDYVADQGMAPPIEEVSTTETRVQEMFWDEDNLQGFKIEQEGLGQVKGFMGSPNYKFFTDRLKLVLPAIRTMYQQGRLRNELDSMYRESMKPLGKRFTPKYNRSKAKLDELLQLGDQYDNGPGKATGKVFNYRELRDGVLTADGRRLKLNDNEIEAYYKNRMFMDTLHHIEDQRLIETAKQRGIQQVNVGGNDKLGKPYLSPRAARTAASDEWIFDPRTNRNAPMNEEQLKEAYNSGFQLVRMEDYENVQDAAGQLHATRWVLANTEDVKGTPKKMLTYREGYLPKITDDGVFFVKQNNRRRVNGQNVTTNKSTLGMFTTKKAADAYRAKKTEQAIQAAISNGRTREQAQREVGDTYEILRDREIPEGNMTDPALFGQSPFTGGRSSKEIFLDEEGNMPVRINAYDAIQRALGHAASSYPMSLLRHNLQKRWLKTAEPHLPAAYRNDFNMAIQHLTADQNGDVYRALQQTHSYIRHVIGAPSDAQLKTRYAIQGMADRMEAYSPRAAAVLNKYSQTNNPTQLARTVTFHSLLGGFNLSQFVVQGLGSSIAMAIDPKNYVKSQQLAMAMNALDQARSPKELEAVKKLLVNSKFIDKDELDNVYDGWKRSGLTSDLLNNADYSEFSRNWELSREALRAGTLPFRMGEAAMRRYTFANAYLNRARGKKLTDEVLKDVMNKQTDLSLNMSRMNKAAWQEGAVLGVATQFRQVTAKYLEMIMGGQLTNKEKMSLVAGQFAMFGFHGVPAGTALQQVFQGAYGWDQGEVPPTAQRFLNEGTFRLAMDAAGMDDINLINRLALGESLVDVWNSASVDSLIDFMGGPAVSHVGAGVVEALKEGTDTLRFLSSGDYSPKAKYQSAEDYVEKVLRGIPIVDDITTSYWYSRGLQLDNSGRQISEDRDISYAEVVALAAGFSDRAPSDIYVSQSLTRKSDERINGAVDKIAGMVRRRFNTGEGLSETDKERIRFMVEINSANEDEEIRIGQLVAKALMEEPRLEREMIRLISFLFNRGQTAENGGMSELMIRASELTEGEE